MNNDANNVFVQKKKLALALGGGGSRALCHLGILHALANAGIRVDAIAGNSMGALIGAVYASHLDAARTRSDVGAFFYKDSAFGGKRKGDGLEHGSGVWIWCKRCLRALVISLNLSFRKGFLWGNPCKKAIATLLPDIKIEALKIPFSSVTLNLTDGRLENITSGSLREAVYAGTNVGVVFAPFRWHDKSYIDAAPVRSVPAAEARALGGEVVLAVDIRSRLPENYSIQNGMDVIMRLEQIESNLINEQTLNDADLVLRPQVSGVFWGDFSRTEEIIKIGEDAVAGILPRLRELLGT